MPYKNIEDKKLASKKWRINNREKCRESTKNWGIKNKENLKLKQTKYNKKMRLELPPYRTLNRKRWSSKRDNKPFNLDKTWLIENYTGYCSLTGIKFKISRKTSAFSPTIDKIDPKIGYTKNNCRFVLMGINSLKYTGTDEEMYTIAEALIKYKRRDT